MDATPFDLLHTPALARTATLVWETYTRAQATGTPGANWTQRQGAPAQGATKSQVHTYTVGDTVSGSGQDLWSRRWARTTTATYVMGQGRTTMGAKDGTVVRRRDNTTREEMPSTHSDANG